MFSAPGRFSEAVRQSEGQVKRLVYASSAAVFGPPEIYPKGALPDDVPLVPSTHYGVFKCCTRAMRAFTFRTIACRVSVCGRGRSTALAAISA